MKTLIPALMMMPLSVMAHPAHAEISIEWPQFSVLAIVMVTTLGIPLLATSYRRVMQRIKKH